MTTAVDEAMAAAMGDDTAYVPQETPAREEATSTANTAAVAQQTATGEAVEGHYGPTSADQAEKLISKAIKAASTFADVMKQILDRKAWEPLGYNSPRQMIRERFTGQLVNPQTGNPYNDAYVRRMSNSAWMLWSLSELCEVPPSELHVVTGVLAKIPAGINAEHHQELVDNIIADVRSQDVHTPEEINAIIDAHLTASGDERKVVKPDADSIEGAVSEARENLPEDQRADTPAPAADDDAAGSAEGGAAARPAEGIDGRYGEVDEGDDWQNQLQGQQAGGDDEADTPEAATATATDAFDDEFATGSQAPEQSVSWEEALDAVRSSEAVTGNVEQVAHFPELFAGMAAKVEASATAAAETISGVVDVCRSVQDLNKVDNPEGIFDPLSDSQLEQMRTHIQDALKTIPLIRAAGQALSALDGVDGLSDVGAAVEAVDSADQAADKLEEFLDEIDFLYET